MRAREGARTDAALWTHEGRMSLKRVNAEEVRQEVDQILRKVEGGVRALGR